MLAAVGLRNHCFNSAFDRQISKSKSDQDHSSNTDQNLKNPVIMILENMQGW
jgi:hypothetical protein